MGFETSPNMLLLHGMDESGSTANRANAGALGSDHDLVPSTASGTPDEGVPSVSDGAGGRAAVIQQEPDGYTDEWRALEGLEDALDTPHPARPTLPISSASDDFAWGCRFRWISPYTEGLADEDFQLLWSFGRSNAVPYLAIGFRAADDTDETQGAHIALHGGPGSSVQEIQDAGDWSATGSPDTEYIVADEWYRVLVRCYFSSTGFIWKVYVYRESTAETYTFTFTGTPETGDWTGSNDVRWRAGHRFDGSLSSAYTTAYADVDDCWLYDAPMSDSDATSFVQSGLSIPWTEPDYHREDHEVYSAVTKEDADYPAMRALPSGATIARHPVDVLCQEIRCRLEGWKAGQPWALRAVDFIFDPAGPFGSHRARQGQRPQLDVGVWRTPGAKPWGACEDAANVEFTYNGPRRRRGFKIRRDVDSSAAESSFCGFWTWRTYADELFWLFKKATKLYYDTGGGASELSSGWNAAETPATFFLDNRLVILTGSKRAMWDGRATIQAFGAAEPASISVAAGAGGTLTGDYYYAVTLYDPVTGDETGPKVSGLVSPSGQKVTITLPATAPESRYTQYRIYRTTDGGTAPNFFYIKSATVAAAVDDTGEPDGTDLIDQVTDSSGAFLGYITATAPDTFALGIAHRERAIYARGNSNPERIYIAEANEPIRFYSSQWIAADGPVRALASWQGRVVVLTDNTVEILESDFIRDADGNLNINRTVISRSVGTLGHLCVIVFQGRIFWMDRRGVFTLQGTEAVPVSDRIADLFPYINTNLGDRIVGGWNHITRTLWWTLPLSDRQDDSSLMQTQFVMPLADPNKWWFHELEATFVGQFDDDLNGMRFGCIDHSGVFKELESYEGDGQEGDEAGTFEDADGISSISERTVTVSPDPGWDTDEHRGKGVVLRDVSTTKLYYYTIRSNTSDTFTCDRVVNALLGSGDGYYVGGFPAWLQMAGHDFGSPNRKVVRQVQYTFADLTKEDLYL